MSSSGGASDSLFDLRITQKKTTRGVVVDDLSFELSGVFRGREKHDGYSRGVLDSVLDLGELGLSVKGHEHALPALSGVAPNRPQAMTTTAAGSSDVLFQNSLRRSI